MSEQEHHHGIVVPRGALIATGVLILFTVTLVGAFRLAGIAPVAQVPDYENSIITQELRFEDGDDGSVIIYEVNRDQSDEVIKRVQAGEGGFIRGVLRSLSRARSAKGIGAEHPFVLEQHYNGSLVLEDPQTEQRIDLRAFGPTNIESFRVMLDSDEI